MERNLFASFKVVTRNGELLEIHLFCDILANQLIITVTVTVNYEC